MSGWGYDLSIPAGAEGWESYPSVCVSEYVYVSDASSMRPEKDYATPCRVKQAWYK